MDKNAKLVDLLSLIPEGRAKAVLRFAFDDLHLSSEDIKAVLHDAHRMAQALSLLLSGGILSNDDDAT